jgi:hypothetical protein
MVANVDFHIFIGSRGGVSNARTRRKGEHNAIWDCIIR